MDPSKIITIDPHLDSESKFTVHFFDEAHITTVVTTSGDEASQWINGVLWAHRPRHPIRLIVALDVQLMPLGAGISVLQLCVDQRCLVFQLRYCHRVPDTLLRFLSDPHITFIGVGIDEDVQKLFVDREISVVNKMDVRTIVVEETEREELEHAGLTADEGCSGEECGESRYIRRGRWDNRFLSMDQLMCAWADVFLSFQIARQVLG